MTYEEVNVYRYRNNLKAIKYESGNCAAISIYKKVNVHILQFRSMFT